MRYYDKTTHTETSTESTTTIPETDTGIAWWFSSLKSGESIIYGDDDMPYKYTGTFHRPIVVQGQVVEGITQEELFATAKTKKLKEIETAKNEAQQAPVMVRGVQFFGGREAGQKYDEALRLAQMMGLLVWNFLSADSGMVEVDEPYATEVIVAVAGETYMLWAKAQEHNAQVNMATTVAEVEAIVWTA